MASPGSGAGGGAQNYRKLFLAHKITRNNTLNKVHVAATELQIGPMLGEAPQKVAPGPCAGLKLTGKI